MKLIAIHVIEHKGTIAAVALVADGLGVKTFRRVGMDGMNDATERGKIVNALANDLRSLEIDVTAEDIERAL